VNLSNGVLGTALRTESIRARLEVRLEDRLDHTLQSSLHDSVASGGDPQPTELAVGLRDQAFAHGEGLEGPSLERSSQFGHQLLAVGDGAGRHPVYASRSCPLIAPDPVPGNDQECRVTHEVVEVVEPTMWVVGRPLVQLGLDLQYSRFRLSKAWPRCVGIHQRSPALPGCGCGPAAPLRHVAGLPDRGLLLGLRPTPTPSADDGPCLRLPEAG